MEIEKVDKNMKATIDTSNTITYFNPCDDDRFAIEGLAFFEKEKKFFRLPIDCKKDVTEAVYWLSSHPAGGQIRFKTNAKKISVKVKNNGDYHMCHMAATGQQGVDLYYRLKGQKHYTFFTCAKFHAPTVEFESVIFESDDKMDKEIIINLPLYEGLDEILIGVEGDATISKPNKHKTNGRIVIYGTSITQGGCASRPGMLFTNILSRRFDVEFINLGFSGSGLGEPEIAHLINQIDDVNMLILDYEANGGSTDDMKDNLEPFIDIFRSKHPTAPILVMTKPPFPNFLFNKVEVARRNFYFNFQKNVVEKRNANGDENIYFYDGSKIFGKKDMFEGSVDGLHPTDLGFYKIANSLQPVLKKILKK